MDTEEVRSVVLGIAQKILGSDPRDLVDCADLKDDLGIDSILRMEFLVAVERRFKVKFKAEDAQNIEKMGDVVQTVQRYAGGA
jgi:acyl carrier protein